jgi:pimeloyl-[acyl-carrier protein] synthase
MHAKAEAGLDINLAELTLAGDALLPRLNELREHDTIHWSEQNQCWIVCGHAEILAGFAGAVPLSNHSLPDRLFPGLTVEQMRQRWPTIIQYQPAAITNADGKDHTRLRKLFVQAFNRPLVQSMRPFVQQRIAALLDRVAEKSRFDFNSEVARRIPGSVILHLLGMSQDYLERLEEWDNIASAALMSPRPTLEWLDRLEVSQREMNEIFMQEIEARRHNPRKDLITELLNAAEAGDRLSHEELLQALFLIIIAGHDSTANSMTLGARAMAGHPEAWTYWRSHQDKAVDNANELMRYVAMISAQPRLVASDFVWQGKQLKKGDVVFLMVAAGNRDPKVFPDPERLDFTRRNDQSLVFGPGMHHCIGHLLAKLQVSELFSAIVERFDGIEVLEEPTFTAALVFRGVSSLKVRFLPRT